MNFGVNGPLFLHKKSPKSGVKRLFQGAVIPVFSWDSGGFNDIEDCKNIGNKPINRGLLPSESQVSPK